MWKVFNDPQAVYMIKLENRDNNTFNLELTNFTYLWETSFSKMELKNNFTETNKHIGATEEQILSYLKDILEDIQEVNISVNHEDDSVLLRLERTCTDLDDAVQYQKILYKFKFIKANQSKFTENITVPAIKTIFFLEKQQEMLVNLIRKKDKELEQYKLEHSEITRNDLKTEKFDWTQVESGQENMLEKVFTTEKSQKFWDKFTEIHGQTKSTTLHVELEPWNQQKRRKVVHSGKKKPKFLLNLTKKC